MKEEDKILLMEVRDIELLTPHPNNPKLHPEHQIQILQNSLMEFEQTQPVVIDEENTILAGHGTVEAAKRAGITEIVCSIKKGLSNEEKLALMISDNSTCQETPVDRLKQGFQVKRLEDCGIAVADFGLEYDASSLQEAGSETSAQATDGTIKQIIIQLSGTDFEIIITKFQKLLEKESETLQDNTGVFLELLENLEREIHANN